MIYVIIGVIIILVINAVGAMLMKISTTMKGYGDNLHAWAICFWLGIPGYLYIISLPDLIVQQQNMQIIDLLNKSEGKIK